MRKLIPPQQRFQITGMSWDEAKNFIPGGLQGNNDDKKLLELEQLLKAIPINFVSMGKTINNLYEYFTDYEEFNPLFLVKRTMEYSQALPLNKWQTLIFKNTPPRHIADLWMELYKLTSSNSNNSVNAIISIFVKFTQELILENQGIIGEEQTENANRFIEEEQLQEEKELKESYRKELIFMLNNSDKLNWGESRLIYNQLNIAYTKAVEVIKETHNYVQEEKETKSFYFQQGFSWIVNFRLNNNRNRNKAVKLTPQIMSLISIINDLYLINKNKRIHVYPSIANTKWKINNEEYTFAWPLPTFRTFLEWTVYLQYWNRKLNAIKEDTKIISHIEILFFYTDLFQ